MEVEALGFGDMRRLELQVMTIRFDSSRFGKRSSVLGFEANG